MGYESHHNWLTPNHQHANATTQSSGPSTNGEGGTGKSVDVIMIITNKTTIRVVVNEAMQ